MEVIIGFAVAAVLHAGFTWILYVCVWDKMRDDLYHASEDIALWVRTQRRHDDARDARREKLYLEMMNRIVRGQRNGEGDFPPPSGPENA